MALEEITRKVVSYCEIPQGLTEGHWISENSCDSYVEYELPENPEDLEGRLEMWLFAEYPELKGTKFFIHLDY